MAAFRRSAGGAAGGIALLLLRAAATVDWRLPAHLPQELGGEGVLPGGPAVPEVEGADDHPGLVVGVEVSMIGVLTPW